MKNIIEKITEIKKQPKGQAIFFFGFYFIFFVFVFLLINIDGDKSVSFKDYESYKDDDFDYTHFIEKNYSYTYKVFLDGIEYQYVGKQNMNNSVFQFNGNNYYAFDNDYYIYSNDSLISVDNPYVLDSLLIDSDVIGWLVSLASLDSKTEYKSGKVVYNYLISTNTINQYLYNINSDFMEEPNRLIISVENNNVNNIVFNLDSFCSLNNICTKSLKVDLSFDDFGEVKEIDDFVVKE